MRRNQEEPDENVTTLNDRKSAKANGKGTKVHGNRRYQPTHLELLFKAEMMFPDCCIAVKYLPQNPHSEWELGCSYI